MDQLAIANLLYVTRFNFAQERELQDQIALVLTGAKTPFEREVRLSARDRIDFMCGAIGVEVKIGGPTTAVQQQLWRYAASPLIESLILVTTRSRHTAPPTILEKPVIVVHLLHSIF